MKKLLLSITLLLSVVPMYSMEEVLKGWGTKSLETEGVTKKYKPEIRKVVYAVEEDGVITVILRRGDFSPGVKDVQISFVGKENKQVHLSSKVD